MACDTKEAPRNDSSFSIYQWYFFPVLIRVIILDDHDDCVILCLSHWKIWNSCLKRELFTADSPIYIIIRRVFIHEWYIGRCVQGGGLSHCSHEYALGPVDLFKFNPVSLTNCDCLINTGHSSDDVSMLDQRRRRWANIETALGEWAVFAWWTFAKYYPANRR